MPFKTYVIFAAQQSSPGRNGPTISEGYADFANCCKNADDGNSFSSRNCGSIRLVITAAVLASLYNAGDYDSKQVPEMPEYCHKNLKDLGEGTSAFGHWHYTYLYSQAMYRPGAKIWEPFRDKLDNRIVREQQADGIWTGNFGPTCVGTCNLILQKLDKGFLPIYHR